MQTADNIQSDPETIHSTMQSLLQHTTLYIKCGGGHFEQYLMWVEL
jgi:hypothetical protein